MTLQEKRLLLLAMSYVRQSDDDFMLYRIRSQICGQISHHTIWFLLQPSWLLPKETEPSCP